jgi:hypothetical protein
VQHEEVDVAAEPGDDEGTRFDIRPEMKYTSGDRR